MQPERCCSVSSCIPKLLALSLPAEPFFPRAAAAGGMATLPVNVGRPSVGGESVASSSMATDDHLQFVSSEVRDILARAWPKPRRTVILPPLESLNMATLLSFHAGSVQRDCEKGEQPARKRMRFKQQPTQQYLLRGIAERPHRQVWLACDGWQQRRAASRYAAAVVSRHYGVDQRQARELLRVHWPSVPPAVKDNFWAMRVSFGMPEVMEQVAADVPDGVQDGPGAMFTWQTPYGRADDVLSKLFAVHASTSDMQEVAQHDESLIACFEDFVEWLREQAKANGMECWAASLELNSFDAAEARVHLHAYVCRHWKFWRTPAWSRVDFKKSEWSWGGMTPHMVVANMRHTSSPMRPLTSGLYYIMAPKIGSIFRRSSLILWKDSVVHGQ